MTRITLGRTGLTVNKNGFGALPIQRVSFQTAANILQKAYYNGINFFDTARVYTDSEEKIGQALGPVRDHIYLATKTMAVTPEAFWKDLHTSLKLLKTDYVDLYQFHNPGFCPKLGDGTQLYEAMLEAKRQGKIRFIGITNHRLRIAKEAVLSGLYDTLQFPFSYLSGLQETELLSLCQERNMGFIAMKALSGGLITDAASAWAYLNQFDGLLPIWGIQREEELEEFLSFQENPPQLTEERLQLIEKDRRELSGTFCRGCGYCMPCPMGIEINNAARIALMLRRCPPEPWLTPEWQEKMEKTKTCVHCGQCAKRCPYGLNPPELLKQNYQAYQAFLKDWNQKNP